MGYTDSYLMACLVSQMQNNSKIIVLLPSLYSLLVDSITWLRGGLHSGERGMAMGRKIEGAC